MSMCGDREKPMLAMVAPAPKLRLSWRRVAQDGEPGVPKQSGPARGSLAEARPRRRDGCEERRPNVAALRLRPPERCAEEVGAGRQKRSPAVVPWRIDKECRAGG